MARTSRNGAPVASFDALDNIDIDDMFGDGGDGLFDEMDMDLVPIGDLTEQESIPAVAAAEENHAAAGETAEDDIPKRRKTKRKPKTPVLLDEEEDQAPKKRRKNTTTGTAKKKGAKNAKEADLTNSKGKMKGMGVPPTVTRGASTTSQVALKGQVAAAGRFGSQQKRGQFALPMSRTSSDKQKLKSKKSSTGVVAASGEKSAKTKKGDASATAANVPEVPKGPPVFLPPISQTSYCGIKPSNSLFYPFLPAMPNEPSIKNRKQYPTLDRINTTFMGFITSTNATKTAAQGSPVRDSENVFRVMMDTLKDLNPSGGQPTADDDKKLATSNAIGSLRQIIAGMDKHRLAEDLFATCSLLKRQYDFLQQNLINMEKWCKTNFSEGDYNQTYGSSEKKKKEVPKESFLSTFKKPIIRIKLKCTGFKESKNVGPLLAVLPATTTTVAAGVADSKKPKKRKSSSDSSLLGVPGPVTPAAEKEARVKTYPELRPATRRMQIADCIAHTARELEAACISSVIARCQAIDRRHGELKKMIEEDDVLVIHTSAMWEYIEKAGYFEDFTEEALNDALRLCWAPDVAKEPPMALQIVENYSRTEETAKASAKDHKVFDLLQSLLVDIESGDEKEEGHRGGSVGDDGDDDESDNDESDDDEDSLSDNFDEPIEASSLPPKFMGPAFVGLVDLSVHERAFLHLRRAGFCENQAPPAVVIDDAASTLDEASNEVEECLDGGDEASLKGCKEKVKFNALPDTGEGVSDANGLVSHKPKLSDAAEAICSEGDTSRGRENTKQEEVLPSSNGNAENCVESEAMEDIVDRMSADLRELNKVNNARASFLESVARSHLVQLRLAKKRSDHETALIAKCQSLLKRSKDSKIKPSKLKGNSKDEYSLPW